MRRRVLFFKTKDAHIYNCSLCDLSFVNLKGVMILVKL
jgi:hypothetical protein